MPLADYQLGKTLGEGGFGTVREATHRFSGQKVAIKIMHIASSSKSKLTKVNNEIDVFSRLSHIEHVAKFIDHFSDEHGFHYIVQDLYGDDLFDLVSSFGAVTEVQARDSMAQMLVAVQGIHAEGICHRDVKLENMVLNANGIHLIDFGEANDFSKHRHGQMMTARVGSAIYVAPEVLKGSYYGGTCDMWSLGVALYILLCGYPPFHGEHMEEIKRSVFFGDVDFSRSEHWSSISAAAKELICLLLTKEPAMRPTAEQALRHRWFLISH